MRYKINIHICELKDLVNIVVINQVNYLKEMSDNRSFIIFLFFFFLKKKNEDEDQAQT